MSEHGRGNGNGSGLGESGTAAATHMLLIALFMLPLVKSIIKEFTPSLFAYFGWSSTYISIPFP